MNSFWKPVTTPGCKCIVCDPIIAVSLGRRIKEREQAIVQLSTRIIHCERVETHDAYEFKVSHLIKEISTLQAQLEHHSQA